MQIFQYPTTDFRYAGGIDYQREYYSKAEADAALAELKADLATSEEENAKLRLELKVLYDRVKNAVADVNARYL
jgi:hypothetical protein